jgi:hypothetical protein
LEQVVAVGKEGHTLVAVAIKEEGVLEFLVFSSH